MKDNNIETALGRFIGIIGEVGDRLEELKTFSMIIWSTARTKLTGGMLERQPISLKD